MRCWLLVVACLLPASSGLADVISESIRLRHISPIELEQLLLPASGDDRPAVRRLLPAGIRAMTAGRDRLEVVGTREAVDAVKSIVRLVDLPARRIRLRACVLAPPDEELAGLNLRQYSVDIPGTARVVEAGRFAVLGDPVALALLARSAVALDVTTAADNNRSVRLFPVQGNAPPAPLVLIPRLNGDGSITLLRQTAAGRLPTGARCRPGEWQLALPSEGPTLLVRMDLLPDD